MIFEWSGTLGIDPGPFTMRELKWMVDERMKTGWLQIGTIAAAVFNANVISKDKSVSANDFIPQPYRYRSKSNKSDEVDFYMTLPELYQAMTGNKIDEWCKTDQGR